MLLLLAMRLGDDSSDTIVVLVLTISYTVWPYAISTSFILLGIFALSVIEVTGLTVVAASTGADDTSQAIIYQHMILLVVLLVSFMQDDNCSSEAID